MLENTYLKSVIDAGYHFQEILTNNLRKRGFAANSIIRNDPTFPDIKASKDNLNLYIEAKSSPTAPITSLRAISYYPTSNRFEINPHSVIKYGKDGLALIEWINSQPFIINQANNLVEKINNHFGVRFDVIGKDSFNKFSNKAEFSRKADLYKAESFTIGSFKNTPGPNTNQAKQAIHMLLPVGKLVNGIFKYKFKRAGGTEADVPCMVIGPSNNPTIRWFGFQKPNKIVRQQISEAIGAEHFETILPNSPGKIELQMKLRFSQDRQQFDVGVLLGLD